MITIVLDMELDGHNEGNLEKEVQPNYSPKFPVVDCWENSKYHAYPCDLRSDMKRDFVKI